jgi:hypothetical protein
MKPTIGRVVHFHEPEPDGSTIERAAIITAVNDEIQVSLTVFPPTALPYAHAHVTQGGPGQPFTWSWPTRQG